MPGPIQHATANITPTSGTTATATATFPSPLTPGNAIVACITVLGSVATPTISSVKTGTLAENWALAKAGTAETAAGHFHVETWVNPNTAAGSQAINIAVSWSGTLTPSNNGNVLVDVYEVPNVVLSAPVDKTSAGGSSSASTFSSGTTAATAQANEIAFGVACAAAAFSASITPPGAYTNQTVLTGTFGGFSEGVAHVSGWQVLSATGTQIYNGSTTSSAANSAAVVTLLQVTAVTGTGAITSTSPDAIAGTGTGPATGTGAITSTSADAIAGAGGTDVAGGGALAGAADAIAGTGGSITGSGGLAGAPDAIHGVGGQLPSGGGGLVGATDRIHGTGTATAPNLIIAISPTGGTDDFGNPYPPGVTCFVTVPSGAQQGTYAISLGNQSLPYGDFASLTFANQTSPAPAPPAVSAASSAAGSGLELVSGAGAGAAAAMIEILDSILSGQAGGQIELLAGLVLLSELSATTSIVTPSINGVPLAQAVTPANPANPFGSPPTGGTGATGVAGALLSFMNGQTTAFNQLLTTVTNLIAQLRFAGVIAP